jgi:transposase
LPCQFVKYSRIERIQGIARDQFEFYCLDDLIGKENPVRVLDAFVNKLDLARLGFQTKSFKPVGRPPFEDSIFMKIYFYGYINGIRAA